MKKQWVIALLLSFTLVSGLHVLSAKAEGVNQSAAITMEKAKQIALKKVKGKVVSEKVEREDGMVKFEFMIQAQDGKYEVEIDKATGKVLEVEKEESHTGTDGHHHGDDDDHYDDDDHHEGDDDRYDD